MCDNELERNDGQDINCKDTDEIGQSCHIDDDCDTPVDCTSTTSAA